jgi:anti-anti-sigma factor
MFEYQYQEIDHTMVFKFSGRLDTLSCSDLAEMIISKIAEYKGSGDSEVLFPGNVVFDLKEVNYIASAFIRICVSTAKSVEKGGFSIQNCAPILKKTFKIAGLDELLNIQ